jgi:hypothetical protein
MKGPLPAQSRAVHSIASRRGAGLAWSGISDLGCNTPAPENHRDHEAYGSPGGWPATKSPAPGQRTRTFMIAGISSANQPRQCTVIMHSDASVRRVS